MIKSVAIISNPKSPNVRSMVHSVIDFFKRQRVDILVDKRTAEVLDTSWCSPDELIRDKADMMVVLGGDGTVLSAARMIGERETPIMGIHMGRLGFLTEISPEEMPSALQKAMNGTLSIRRCMRLECEIFNGDGQSIFKAHALNEVALSKGAIARIIEFCVRVDGKLVNDYRADGYIVSTPTGSTAYSLSAGGPIVQPRMRLIILSPICAHSLSDRPLVVPAESIIRIDVQGERPDVFVSYDGQVGKNLQPGESLVIRQTSFDTNLYCMPEKSFFMHLQSKFGWGRL